MPALPDRLEQLIDRLEAGETITRADVDRAAALIALDTAQLGRDFVRAAAADNDRALAALEDMS